MGIKVLSLFDGISCGQLALQRAKIPYDAYFSSEVDTPVIELTQHHFPKTIQLGDILNWKSWNIPWEEIDLIMAGFPCQSWSFSGKGKGFDDPRGNLALVLVELFRFAKTKNPNLKFLFENVKMKKEFESKLNDLFGVEPITINSSLVSAQNRVRLYWTNIPNITQLEDKKIFWQDVRERNVSLDNFYYTDKGLAWLARHSNTRKKPLKTFEGEEVKMQMLEASHSKLYSSQRFFGIPDIPADESIASIRGRRISFNGTRADYDYSIPITQYIEFRYDKKSNCLSTVGKDNVVVPFTLPNRIPKDEFFFRYLTVVECERLQTLPDGYCSKLSKTNAYKAIGNGWTVDVIAHILKHMVY